MPVYQPVRLSSDAGSAGALADDDDDAAPTVGDVGVDAFRALGDSDGDALRYDGSGMKTLDGAGDGEPASATGRRLGLPTWRLFLLNAFWFSYSLYFFVLSIVTIPSEVKAIMGDEQKGFGMFVLFIIAGSVNVVVSIVLGYVSDRTYSPFGRRYTWMVCGTIAMIPLTMLLPTAISIYVYTALYTGITIVSVIVSIPYNGLFADVVSNSQRGKFSAIMGAMAQIGNLCGAILGIFYTMLGSFGTYAVVASIWCACLATTIISVREPAFGQADVERIKQFDLAKRQKYLAEHAHSSRGAAYGMRWVYATVLYPLLEPLIVNIDFRWVFMSRFMMQLGQFTVQEYLQYYLDNCIKLPVNSDGTQMTPETAVSVIFLPLLVAATISSIVGGIVSDRLGNRRKILMYISGLTMVFCCCMFTFVREFYVVTIFATLFGAGYGCFLAVDFALVMDVLPSADDVARDIGLWHLALVIPQIFATPLAGLLLDFGQEIGKSNGMECLGYAVIFAIAALYIVVGTFMVSRIKAVK